MQVSLDCQQEEIPEDNQSDVSDPTESTNQFPGYGLDEFVCHVALKLKNHQLLKKLLPATTQKNGKGPLTVSIDH